MTLPAGSRTTDHALQHRGQRHVALVAAALALLSAAGRVRAAVPRDAVPGALCPESMRIESMILAFVPRDPAARGFERVRPWPGRLGIGFDGPAGRVRRAFHTALREYTWQGRRHHAPEGPPLLPVFGTTRPSALLGLDSFAAPRPHARSGGATFLAPADVATVYGLAPAYAAGARGLGASVAVVAGSDFADDDVALFRRSFGLPPSPVVKHFVSSNPGIGDSSALLEVLLDTQWA